MYKLERGLETPPQGKDYTFPSERTRFIRGYAFALCAGAQWQCMLLG
jgi:hypothetical protein